jgi:apolipoprotein N-acyltransferase
MKRYIAPVAIVVFVVVEILLALYGPMAFVQKPSVIVANPYSYGIDEDEVDQVFEHVQRIFARTKLFRVISHDLIEDYYFEKQDDPDFSLDRWLTFTEYQELAADLELEQIAVCIITPAAETVSITIILRQANTGDSRHRFTYTSPDIQSFIDGRGIGDVTFNVTRDFRIQTKGIGIFDNLFFAFLAGQLIFALFLCFGREADTLNQILIVSGLVLGLFAFVYAKNAGMDYVQRFIAEKGKINLAGSTLIEQLYTAIRFLPLLVTNLFFYITLRMKPDRKTLRGVAGIVPFINAAAAKWGIALALLSGFLSALSLPSFMSLRGFPALGWIALVPLFLAILNASRGKGLFYGIAFGALQSLIVNYWHGTYSYISLAFTVLICCALYTLFFTLLIPMISRNRLGFLVAPVLWVTFEFSRSLFYIAYPWGFIGVSQYLYRPIIQVADITGVWGVTFLIVLINAAIAWSIGYPGRRTGAKISLRPLLIAGIAFTFVALYGVIRPATLPKAAERDMRVVLAQQNTDPRKHDYQLSLDTLEELTRAAVSESAPRLPDLVVWPEGGLKTDIRYWLDRPEARGTGPDLVEEIFAFQKELGTWLVTGTQDHVYLVDEDEKEQRRNYNTSVLFEDTGEIQAFYHKMHLVPFTEHFPYKEELPWLTKLLDKFDTSDWLAGDRRTVYRHPVADFFTPICFEDIFPDDIRRFVRDGADLIVNISNDYWSLTPVEGKQHAVHAMFRAVENRRPMVRATASGLTTYITPTGAMWPDPPEYYQADYMMVDIPITERGITVYTRFGDWFAIGCGVMGLLVALYLLSAAVVGRIRREKNAK